MAVNQLVALAIMTLALSGVAVNVQAMKIQRQRMDQEVQINRLAKEASQEVREGQEQVTLQRAGFQAVANHSQVQVLRGKQLVLEVKRWNAGRGSPLLMPYLGLVF